MNSNQLVPQKGYGDFLDALEASIDPSRGEGERKEKQEQIRGVVTAFFRRPAGKLRDAAQRVQKMIVHASTTKADIPNFLTDQASVFDIVKNYDRGWEQAFEGAAMEPGKEYWETGNMTNGIQFRQVPEGGRVLVESVAGSLELARVDKYGGAVGWTDEMIRFRKLNVMQRLARMKVDSFEEDMANRHYGLLAAAASETTSYQTPGTTERGNDIKTIEAAAFAIADRLKDKGVGNTLSQEMVLYANPILWARIIAALRQTTQDVPGAPNGVLYSIRFVPTFNDYLTNPAGGSNNSTALLCLPGHRNQKAMPMQPTSYFNFDPQSLTFIEAVWSYYGAIAEAKPEFSQCQKVEFA